MLQVLGQPHVVLSIAVLVGNGPALQYQGEGVGLLPEASTFSSGDCGIKNCPVLQGSKHQTDSQWAALGAALAEGDSA